MEYGFFECGCGPCGCIGVKKICKEDHCSIALKQGGWGLLRGWFLGLVGDCMLMDPWISPYIGILSLIQWGGTDPC